MTAVPQAPQGFKLTELVRAPIYSSSVDLVTVFQPDTCTSDSCAKWLWLYRWNIDRHAYEPRDSVPVRSAARISTQDLTGDGLDELIITTRDDRRQGINILGVTSTTHVLVSRYERDTIVPQWIPVAGATGLVEFDSLYSTLIAGVPVAVPKRYLSVQGEFFLESPTDSNWSRFVDRARDSIHLVLSLTRDEMRAERHPDPGLQLAFVRASIGSALLDTSWYHAQQTLTAALQEYTSKLSATNYQALARLSLTPRASHFVRQSMSWNPQLLEALGDLDDAIAIRDTARCYSIANYLLVSNPDPNALVRGAIALVGNDLAPQLADRLLQTALAKNPRNVSALRARAVALERMGKPDSSRALLIRSLQFDSTSSEALRIRQEFGY